MKEKKNNNAAVKVILPYPMPFTQERVGAVTELLSQESASKRHTIPTLFLFRIQDFLQQTKENITYCSSKEQTIQDKFMLKKYEPQTCITI